jgi:hypothetical protein
MSVDDQKKQQGELTEVFINNNKLSLKAVIRQGQGSTVVSVKNNMSVKKTVALISVVDLITGANKIERHAHNTQVYGYHLTIEKNTQIKLVKNSDSSNQQIILTMYKN